MRISERSPKRLFPLFFAFVCIVSLFVIQPSFGQITRESNTPSKNIFRLEDALRLALEQNFAVRLAKNSQQTAENNNSGLRSVGAAGMLPNVNLNATWNESLDNAEQRFLTDTTGERILRRTGARTDRYNAVVQLDWTLFNGFRMFAVKERLGEQEQRSAILTRQAMENTVAQVMAGYFTIVEQETLLNALRTALSLSQERLRIVETKNRVGGASELDAQNALVDMNADSAAFMRQEAQMLNSKVALMQVLGNTTQFAPSAVQIQDSIVVRMALRLEELEGRVKARNSLLLASVIDQRIAALALREAESFHYPTLTALVNYNFAGTESQVGIFAYNRTNGVNFGVAGQVNIFNGFNIERQIQNAKIDQLSAELQYGEIQNRITAQLHQTYRNFQNSLSLARLEQENVRLARSASTIALEKFRLGGLSSLDLRQVQQNYLRAESRLITALADAKRAEIELMRLSGDLVQ